MIDKPKPPPSAKVFGLIEKTLTFYLRNPDERQKAIQSRRQHLEETLRKDIDTVLSSASISYRDAVIIQLAYGIQASGLDLTRRPRGARTVAQMVGAFLSENHVRSVKDAYQNIAKNTPELVRGNFEEFDRFLRWAADGARTAQELEAAFQHACSVIASTARPVLPMPPLDLGRLTFSAVCALLEELYAIGSQGAYEQFAVAALLQQLVEQSGIRSFRVETKSLHASDKSSRAAGDIQILTGNRVVDAYEVTANLWEQKIDGASRTIRDNDLTRLHIVARLDGVSASELYERLARLSEDISVLELSAFTAALVSSLTRRFRGAALNRLYELLDRYQPDIERVNAYVEVILRRKLHQPVG